MNPNTGKIVEVKDEAEARERGLVPIPAEELARIERMSARRRRRWARKKLEQEAKAAGVNMPELCLPPVSAFNRYVDTAERNAVKRLRKARLRPKQPSKCR